jgi:hypothetical protein
MHPISMFGQLHLGHIYIHNMSGINFIVILLRNKYFCFLPQTSSKNIYMMHRERPEKIMHAHEGPPTIVNRFANLPSLVFPGKNKVGYFLDRPCTHTHLQNVELLFSVLWNVITVVNSRYI